MNLVKFDVLLGHSGRGIQNINMKIGRAQICLHIYAQSILVQILCFHIYLFTKMYQ